MGNAQGIRAGRAYVELGTENAALDAGLQAGEAKIRSFGQSVRTIGLGLSAASVLLTAPITAITYKTADLGLALLSASQRTGLSTEALSELQYAAEQTGTEIESLETGIRKMQRAIVGAAQGSDGPAKAIKLLGLTVQDLAVTDPAEQLSRIAEGMSKITDPAIQAATAVELFGRNGTQLLPMLAAGAAGLEQWRQRARALGLTESTENTRAAAVFKLAINDLTEVLTQMGQAVGLAVMPLLQRNIELFTRLSVGATKWAQENKSVILTVFRVATGVGALGGGLIALGTAIDVVGGSLSSISSVGSGALGILWSMVSPLGLLTTGALALGGYLVYSSGMGVAAIKYLRDSFGDLKEDGLKAFKGISDALSGAQWGIAARIAWNTLKIEWNRGVSALVSSWASGIGPIGKAWSDLLELVGKITKPAMDYLGTSWGGIWIGFRAAMTKVIDFGTYAFSVMEIGVANWAQSLDVIWESIKTGFIKLLVDLGKMLGSFLSRELTLTRQFSDAFVGMILAIVSRDKFETAVWGAASYGILNEMVGGDLLKSLQAAGSPSAPKTPQSNQPLGPQIDSKYKENKAAIDATIGKLGSFLDGLTVGGGAFTEAGEKARKELVKLKEDRENLLRDAAAAAAPRIPTNSVPRNFKSGIEDLLSKNSTSRGTFGENAGQALNSNSTQTLLQRIATATEQTARKVGSVVPTDNAGFGFV